MDSLSRLIELSRISGLVDYRCYLGGTFDIDHERLPANEAAFHLVVSGEARVVVPGADAFDISAGDLVVLVRDGRHRIQSRTMDVAPSPVVVSPGEPFVTKQNTTGEPDLDLLCGRFVSDTPQANMIFEALPSVLHVRLSSEHAVSSMAGLVDILRGEVVRMDEGASTVVTALSQALLVFVLRWVTRNGAVPKSLLAVMAEPRLARAMSAVLASPAADWTVARLADHASMSRATFARHFESTAGASPLEVVTRLRMDMARGLLRTTTASVGAVGEEVGYQSEAAFSRAFSKATGQSPAHYRRLAQAG